MQTVRALFMVIVGVWCACTMTGCGSSGNGEGNTAGNGVGPNTNEALVTVRGTVDDGTATSPIASAACYFVDSRGTLLAETTAERNGTFHIEIPPEVEGFMGCSPPGFPKLTLATFVSTVGVPAGQTVPATGFEEVSPRTTLVANILVQTLPPNPQARKTELLAALAAQDPDLIALAGAATALFDAMLQQQIVDVDFSTASDDGGGGGGSDSGGGGSSGASDGGGVSGDAGDGTDFSPLAGVPCEFVSHPMGDSALEDLLNDGVVDRPELQAIADEVAQDTAVQGAFARLFPHGMQPLASNGQPLRTMTDTRGRYFLPVPPGRPGFIQCAPTPSLALSTFVEARQGGESLTEQHVSPPSQFFAAFLSPLLPEQEVQAVENNFLTDIGELRRPTDGIVRVEAITTAQGRMVADTDGDGLVCSFLSNPTEAAIQYLAAAAASYTATTLFKALLIEASMPAVASYEAILADVFLRTTAMGLPRLELLETDLRAGGVPEERAATLAALLNTCITDGIERTLGIPPLRAVRAGRLRVTVRDMQGALVPRAQATVEGATTLFGSQCVSVANRMMCSTDAQGTVIIVLQGERSLAVTPVLLSVVSENGALTSQMQVDFLPPSTRDIVVTLRPQ